MQSGQQLVLGTVLLELHARHSVHDSIDKEQRHTTLTYTHTHTRAHTKRRHQILISKHAHTHTPTHPHSRLKNDPGPFTQHRQWRRTNSTLHRKAPTATFTHKFILLLLCLTVLSATSRPGIKSELFQSSIQELCAFHI